MIVYKNKMDAVKSLLLVVGVLVVVKQALLPFTQVFAGPISTLSAIIVATLCLRRYGFCWADLGFKKPESLMRTLLWSGAVFIFILVASGLGGALADLFFERAPRTNRFGDIQGDWAAFLLYLGLIWTHAAFFEELLFRAFIISHLQDVFGSNRLATPAAVILAALFFGYRHYYYQGMHGAVVTGLIGLSLGTYYARRGFKNMWPLILAHGYTNSLGFIFRFLGVED